MYPRNRPEKADERGYSLAALVVALAVMAIIIVGIMMVIFQIHTVSENRTSHIVAIREVQNAGRRLTLDGQMAATIVPTADADGFPLTMTWSDAEDNEYEVVYDIVTGDRLERQHYTNKIVNPDPDATTLVALHIDPANTSCDVNENEELIVNITATVNDESASYTETRIYRIFPRQRLN